MQQQPRQEGAPALQEGVAAFQVQLVPADEQLLAIVDVDVRELSGAVWVGRFPTSRTTDDLVSPFREGCGDFLAALRAANANVTVSATLRPPNRAYLMHWAWKIVNEQCSPQDVPGRDGINIKWDHSDRDGNYDSEASIAAARAMVNGYGIARLQVAPSLTSRHIEGNAIDMTIGWTGSLTISDANGDEIVIDSEPRDGMNKDLHGVGASYGVIKFHGGARDRPHWSNDGR